jgi:hypothetical protein
MSGATPVREDAEPISPSLSSRYAVRHHRRDCTYSPFVPILLAVICALAWPAFQCYQLINEKQALETVYGSQVRAFEDAGKLRGSLDVLARETALLAERGNAGAKLVVSELARRGITINTTAPPSSPPTTTK